MTKVSRLALLGALAMFGVGEAASPAAASLLGINITNPSPFTSSNDQETVGYQFAVNNAAVEATALGVFDGGSVANLNLAPDRPTTVQLWTAGGTALLSTPVSVTAANYFQDGLFAFVAIAPITLAANSNYIVAAQGDGLDFALFLNPGDYTVDPYITYVAGEFNQTVGSLNFPNMTGGDVGIFGGNVELVPEPMSLSIFGFGLAGLGLLRRRRNRA